MHTKSTASFCLTAGLLFVSPTFGLQDPAQPAAGTPAPPRIVEQEAAPSLLAPPEVRASLRARKVLADKNWTTGYDAEKKRGIMVGTGSIPPNVDQFKWIDARNAAFRAAMFDAKRQLVEYLSAEVSTRSSQALAEDAAGTKALEEAKARLEQFERNKPVLQEMSALDKAQYAISQEMDSFMKGRGYDLADPSAEAAKVREEFFTIEKNAIETLSKVTAQSETGGLLAYQVFESSTEVAVITIFHEGSSVALSRAMLGLGEVPADPAKVKENGLEYVMKLYSEGSLPFTQGVRMRRDEKGNLSLYAFAHVMPARPTTIARDIAKGRAETDAMGLLRAFAGEAISSERESASLTELSSVANVADDYEERFSSQSSYEQYTKAIAESLEMPGMQQIWSDQVPHPTLAKLGLKVMPHTAVYKYNLSAATDAARLRQRFNVTAGSKGGGGVAEAEARKAAAEAEAKKRGNGPTPKPVGGNGEGAGGDDDDIGGGR